MAKLFEQMGDEIKEIPGEVSRFAQKVPGMLGNLPGRMASAGGRGGRAISNTFGLGRSGLKREEEAFGMNPRRAYWAAALADLSNFGKTGQMQGTGMQANQAQQQHMQGLKQAKQMEQYRNQMALAAIMNAKKPRGGGPTNAMRNAEAMGLKPGTPEYNEFIRKVETKPLVDMGTDMSGEFYSDILGRIPDARIEADQAQRNMAQYSAMETLIPHLGKTGVGKDMMTSFRSALNQFGMDEMGGFLDKLGELSGIDFFSGDQGATELFRALGSEDIVGQAKLLYPVSNSDINLLREMVASLRINDPDALRVLIQNGRMAAQAPISRFNEYKGWIDNAPIEGLPKIEGLRSAPTIDLRGVVPTEQTDEVDRVLQRLRDAGYPGTQE